MNIEQINVIVDILRIFAISIGTYCIDFKLIDQKIDKRISKLTVDIIMLLIISLTCKLIKVKLGFVYNIILETILLGVLFSKRIKNNIINCILTTLISLSINYIIFSFSIALGFIVNRIVTINNEFLNVTVILYIYSITIYYFFKIKKLRKGISFLKNNSKNDYFEILILNISLIIIFTIIILSDYNQIISRNLGTMFIIICVIMATTIYKCVNAYYKQKLLIQELNNTKEELENKKQEINRLEKENLNFSKTSHSIVHKQKALEYKLNQLMLKNEISEKIDLKDRINIISKEISDKTPEIELSKTNIPEIDDMLKYMQSECIKNKIDFQLQINGNIHYMINNYVSKENLEILLADHIKNAIIAINYSNNINKSILVRLGNIDGIYSLYVYDSGIEFEIDTLLNLGKRPNTTHSDNGGTGMGFMNTFDTLNKYKASLIIEEYNKPNKEDFTKLIKIEFDKKNEFKIFSYRRHSKIRKQSNADNIVVESITL